MLESRTSAPAGFAPQGRPRRGGSFARARTSAPAGRPSRSAGTPAPGSRLSGPDYLGPEWVATSFALAEDDGGCPPGRPDVAVLVHERDAGRLAAESKAADHPGTVDAVVLNSPWPDHYGSRLERGPLTRAVDRLGARSPSTPISWLLPRYARSLHRDYGGEFDFDPAHKPLVVTAVRAGFLRTVRRAQARVAAGGVRIGVPLLVAHSDASGHPKLPRRRELANRDCVLGVEDMKRLAPLLSPDVEMLEVPGGRHDLALSERPARELYTREVTAWVARTLGL